MASFNYNRFKANLMNKEVDLGTGGDTIKIALMTTSHSGSTATDNTWSDVSANEISGTGYTAGGETLANQSVTQAAATKFDGDDVTWSSATISAYYAVIYDDTLANDDLIASIDFGGEQAVTGADFTIIWSSSGIITLS